MDNREECRKMGEEGRRFVARNFTANKFRRSVLDAVKEAADSRHGTEYSKVN